MLTNAIGFVGIDCYDLILYLAKVLSVLGERVLVSDNSDTGALSCCIPEITTWESGTVNYFGVDCTQDVNTIDESYNWVFIDFGFSGRERELECDEIYYVTDYKRHNVKAIAEHLLSADILCGLIMRDRLTSKITMQSVLVDINSNTIAEDASYEIFEQQSDLTAQLMMQYNVGLSFKLMSQSMKEFICAFLSDTFNKKEIMNCIKSVIRGKQ